MLAFGLLESRTLRWICAAAIAATVLSDVREADACGGCFHDPAPAPENVTQVTGHRMIFSISPSATTLWDQIRYSGDPASFAWVLPIRGEVDIGLSSDLLFAELESAPSHHRGRARSAPLAAWRGSLSTMSPKAAKAGAPQTTAVPETDPVWRAALNAPIDDEPETDEERAQVASAKAEVAAGARMRSAADVEAAIVERREREG